MKTILIITAMAEEMLRLNEAFHYHAEKVYGAFHFFETQQGSLKIITVICGIGKVNAATCTALGCILYQPNLVVNIGAAGGVHPQLAVGDVVIASQFNYHDADTTAFGYAYGQIPGMPALYQADKVLVDFLVQAEHAFPFAVLAGLLSSGDSFVADEHWVVQIKKRFPEIIGLDMESCAIAQACHQLQVPFCCLRGISDSANGQAKQSFSVSLNIAVTQVTQVLQVLLTKLEADVCLN